RADGVLPTEIPPRLSATPRSSAMLAAISRFSGAASIWPKASVGQPREGTKEERIDPSAPIKKACRFSVWDGVSPYRRRYSTENRPQWGKPERSAISITLAPGEPCSSSCRGRPKPTGAASPAWHPPAGEGRRSKVASLVPRTEQRPSFVNRFERRSAAFRPPVRAGYEGFRLDAGAPARQPDDGRNQEQH